MGDGVEMAKLEIRLNRTLPSEVISLMKKCGEKKHNPKTVVKALRDGLFMAGVYVDGELAAFGRVSGDGAIYFLITDFMVAPRFENLGLEMKLYKEIDDYLLTVAPNDCRVLALTNKRFEHIFQTFGYEYMDADYRTVMVRE